MSSHLLLQLIKSRSVVSGSDFKFPSYTNYPSLVYLLIPVPDQPDLHKIDLVSCYNSEKAAFPSSNFLDAGCALIRSSLCGVFGKAPYIFCSAV